MSPQKIDDGNSAVQTSNSAAKCVICEVMRQTQRNPIEDEMVYQRWLRGRKMTKKLQGELWKIQLANTANEKKRLDGIFKSIKYDD